VNEFFSQAFLVSDLLLNFSKLVFKQVESLLRVVVVFHESLVNHLHLVFQLFKLCLLFTLQIFLHIL